MRPFPNWRDKYGSRYFQGIAFGAHTFQPKTIVSGVLWQGLNTNARLVGHLVNSHITTRLIAVVSSKWEA